MLSRGTLIKDFSDFIQFFFKKPNQDEKIVKLSHDNATPCFT
jgi:hypothetical protein